MSRTEPKLTYSANFKRDYVAYSAIGIFFAVVVAEIVLAIGIPMRISASEIFPEQVRRQKMIDDFDYLRNFLERFRPPTTEVGEEAKLVEWTNSRLGLYLRRNIQQLTPAEIDSVHERVRGMLKIFSRLAAGRCFNQELDFNPGTFADIESARLEMAFKEEAEP